PQLDLLSELSCVAMRGDVGVGGLGHSGSPAYGLGPDDAPTFVPGSRALAAAATCQHGSLDRVEQLVGELAAGAGVGLDDEVGAEAAFEVEPREGAIGARIVDPPGGRVVPPTESVPAAAARRPPEGRSDLVGVHTFQG